jgi:hypothetical protein
MSRTALTLEALPESVLAHILSLVSQTPASQTLAGLKFFLLPGAGAGAGSRSEPGPGAGTGTGAGARAVSGPAAHSIPTPRLATPTGARELAALSLTCRSMLATLSAEVI